MVSDFRRIIVIGAAASILGLGCGEDSNSGGKPVVTQKCENTEKKCNEDGNLEICKNGRPRIEKCTFGCNAETLECNSDPDKTPCDASFVDSCLDPVTAQQCVNKSVERVECKVDKHCENGKCVSNKNIGDSCKDETYKVCVSDAWYQICDNGRIKERQCKEEDGGTFCREGACVECDPLSYGTTCDEDGVTLLHCVDNHVVPKETCELGVCSNNKCAECIPETYEATTCKDESKLIVCKDYSLKWYVDCNENERCVDGVGCQSKCGADFKNSCVSERELKYCSREGEQVTQECPALSKCVEDRCKTEVGESCDPETYAMQCVGDNQVKFCAKTEEGEYIVTAVSCAEGSFCGNLNGKVGCAQRCDQEGKYNCLYDTESAWGVLCQKMTLADGSPALGMARVDKHCSKNRAVNCGFDTVTKRAVINMIDCTESGSTCDTETGMCSGMSECPSLGGSCNGNVATNCVNFGAGKYNVTQSCNASAGEECVVYTQGETERADCYYAIDEVEFDGTVGSYTVSNLGTCVDDKVVILQVQNGENKFIASQCDGLCRNVDFSYQDKDYTYAYCE